MKSTDIYRPILSNNRSNRSIIMPGQVGRKFTEEEKQLLLSLSSLIRDRFGRLETFSRDKVDELFEGIEWQKTKQEIGADERQKDREKREAERMKSVNEAECATWPWVEPMKAILPDDKLREDRVKKWKLVFAGLAFPPSLWPEELQFSQDNNCRTVPDFFKALADQPTNQPTNQEIKKMKNQVKRHHSSNVHAKIRQQATHLADRYVKMIEDGVTPPLLAYLVEKERFKLIGGVNDARLNQRDTVHTIQMVAHALIKNHLAANPELNRTFGRMRKEENIRREKEYLAEHQAQHPSFPLHA
jgi:hypothetical protein